MKVARFSRIGFILAAAGSAVGLGNIWKFPYIAGEYGGGAFILIYLLTVALIGFSIMIAEMSIGYLGRKDGVTSFEILAPKHKSIWKYGGFMGMSGLLIMTFYSVVIGWIFHYIIVALTALPDSVQSAQTAFTHMLHESISSQIFYHTIAFIIITLILFLGIKGGIEKLNLLLMPLLFIIVGGMFIYALTLDGFTQAWHFMLALDFSKLNSEAFAVAVGHAFFTLSLGMGAILTYSASLPKDSNLISSSFIVVLLDTGIALVAGLMLFTFLYEFGAEPSKGPGLVFISLPAVFYVMGSLGTVLAVLFFVALAFAGLTSAVSLVEPMVQYLIDRFRFSRLQASIATGLFFYTIGIVALLSNTTAFSDALTLGSRNLFDWLDYITAAIMLPVGGMIMAIFIGFVVPKSQIQKILLPHMGRYFALWYAIVRYVAPVALFAVMLNLLGIITF